LTSEELTSVCQSATCEMRTLFAIGLYSGLRLGDAVRLRWEDVDKEVLLIKASPTKNQYKADSKLTLPIHPALRVILLETPRNERKGPLTPSLCAAYINDRSAVCKLVQKHFAACGITTTRPATGQRKRAVVEVGYHSLRHSFVSICARRGVPLNIVQDLCGHSSPAIQRRYLHTNQGDAKRAIAMLPSFADADAEPDQREELKAMIDTLPDAEIGRVLKDIKKFDLGG